MPVLSTPTKRRSIFVGRGDAERKQSFSQEKRKKRSRVDDAGVAQSVERILGKDEVGGPSPLISSIRKKRRLPLFSYGKS